MAKLTICDVLDWSWSDVESLEKYINIAEKFGIGIEDIKEDISGYGLVTDINNWFYSTTSMIFNEVMNRVKELIAKKIDEEDEYEIYDEAEYIINKMIDDFSPYINYMDSWFGNEILDYKIDWNKETDEIIYDVLNEILKLARKEIDEYY